MQQSGQRYRYLAFAAAILLITGASIPTRDDKELIIRLQGEVVVLQRQIRDLQESFDKWQVKSETSLNNLGSVSDTSARTLSSIDDKLQRNQGSQANAVAAESLRVRDALDLALGLDELAVRLRLQEQLPCARGGEQDPDRQLPGGGVGPGPDPSELKA